LGDDTAATRLGLLLYTTGREIDGLGVLQQVVDLMPGTHGAEVATAVLEQAGALRAPTAEHLRSIYLDGLPTNDVRRKEAQARLESAEDSPLAPAGDR